MVYGTGGGSIRQYAGGGETAIDKIITIGDGKKERNTMEAAVKILKLLDEKDMLKEKDMTFMESMDVVLGIQKIIEEE